MQASDYSGPKLKWTQTAASMELVVDGRVLAEVSYAELAGQPVPVFNRLLEVLHSQATQETEGAAVERAARAIHRARGLSDGSFGLDAYCECREFAEAALRAAGETP